MKELIMIFAVFVTLAVGVEMIPLMGSNKKLAMVEGFLGEKSKEKIEQKKKLPKHNLNSGQLKRMPFLKYIDKV